MELFSEIEVSNKLQGKLGLKNYGDSSFVNAIVQAISNVEPVCFTIREMPVDLPRSIGSIENAGERNKRLNIFYSFRRILRELWKDSRMLIEPAVFLRRMNEVEILKDSVSNKNIEDTFLYLLEALHDALVQPVPALFEARVNFKPTAPIWETIAASAAVEGDWQRVADRGAALQVLAHHRSVITDAFQGIVVSSVTCPCCAFQEETLDPFFTMSLDVVCHSEKAAKKKALGSDFSVSSTSAAPPISKRSRKIYTEETGREGGRRSISSTSAASLQLVGRRGRQAALHVTTPATPAPVAPAAGTSAAAPTQASSPVLPCLSPKPCAALSSSTSLSPAKVLPSLQDDSSPCPCSPSSGDSQPGLVVAASKRVEEDNIHQSRSDLSEEKHGDASLRKQQQPQLQLEVGGGAPFRKCLTPLMHPTTPMGGSKKKKRNPRTNSLKRLNSGSDDVIVSDNIDNRIDMELSQSSSESTPNNVDATHQVQVSADVVNQSKMEKANILKEDLHNKMKLELLANKRKQREHQKNLSTMSAAQIGAKNKRRSSLLFSFKASKAVSPAPSSSSSSSPFKSLSKNLERSTTLLETGKQMSSLFASQAKVAMDIGQKAVLHDCIQAHLADVVVPDFTCMSCSQASEVTRKKRIANAPEVLVFHFKRFMKSGFFQTKDNTLVHFPLENFDISDFLDMTSGYFKGGWDQSAVYDLQVLVRHVGKNKDSNHYSTLARHDPGNKWFEYHDHRVRVVSRRYVSSREALMLFYVRKKPVGGQHMSSLREGARGAVLQRREALVDEVNYQLRMDHLHQVNVLKNTLSQKTNRMINSMRLSLMTSVRLVATMARRHKAWSGGVGGSGEGSSDGLGEEVSDLAVSSRGLRKKSLLSLASFAEHAMGEANITPKKRVLGPGWRTVRKSLQKIVLLGEDPSLSYDHANIILEIPPRKHVFVSLYWLIKFLSFSEPGPLCNHDIACCHRALKPQLYSCRKRICIPVPLTLFFNLRDYFHEKYGYPRCLLPSEVCADTFDAAKSNEIVFRELTSTIPCGVCIRQHDELMLRRKTERERVVLESIRDGFEDDLLPEEDAARVKKAVQMEKRRRDLEVKNNLTEESNCTEVNNDTPVDFWSRMSFRRGTVAVRPVEEVKHYCVVSKLWLDAWKKFALAGQYEDIEFPTPPPGPIHNFDLLTPGSSCEVRPGLVLDQDYCVLSPGAWAVLHDTYGGGPVLLRDDVNIYSSHSGEEKVGVILC